MDTILNRGRFVLRHSYGKLSTQAILKTLSCARCCNLEAPFFRSLVLPLRSKLLAGTSLNVEYGATFNRKQRRRRHIRRVSCAGGESTKDVVFWNVRKEEALESEAAAAAETDSVKTLLRLTRAVGQFAKTNFPVVAIFSSVTVALACPGPGQLAQQMGLTKWCSATIFLLFGLSLRSEEIEKASKAWSAGLLGLVCILLVTPLAAIPILSLQFSPKEFIAGLAIFACVPTTLSSAVSLTQVAGANTTLALGLTIVSNLISIVTTPFALTRLLGSSFGVSIAPGPLLQSLTRTLLLPLILGKILRESFSDLAKFMDGKRRKVSVLTSFIQSLVPWMQLSCSKAKLLQIEPYSLLFIASVGLALHILYLATNSLLIKFYPSPSIDEAYNSRAVLLVSSQKSFIVAVAVIDSIGGVFGNAGLLVLPCIAGQLSQVIVDSILVNKWLQSDAKERFVPSQLKQGFLTVLLPLMMMAFTTT